MSHPLAPDQVHLILSLQARNWTHEAIAREVGCARRTVIRILKRLNRKVADTLHEEIVDERQRQVACLQWLQMEAVLAWERSQQEAVTLDETVETREVDEEPEPPRQGKRKATAPDDDTPSRLQTITKRRTTIEPRDGSPAFLAAALACMAAIRKLYGLEKGSKPGDLVPIIHGIVAVFLKYIPEDLHAGILDALNRDMGPAFGTFAAAGAVPAPRPSDLAPADAQKCSGSRQDRVTHSLGRT
jgi:hypothetical protein